MVNVGGKGATERVAVARGRVRMAPATVALISAGGVPKGDVLAVARVAGILAAKETARLVPLCHPLPLTSVAVDFHLDPAGAVEIRAEARTTGPTGVEMEALAAVAGAALTIYDMCKAADRWMVIEAVRLVEKRGGRGGDYVRPGEEPWPGAGSIVPREEPARTGEEPAPPGEEPARPGEGPAP